MVNKIHKVNVKCPQAENHVQKVLFFVQIKEYKPSIK